MGGHGRICAEALCLGGGLVGIYCPLLISKGFGCEQDILPCSHRGDAPPLCLQLLNRSRSMSEQNPHTGKAREHPCHLEGVPWGAYWCGMEIHCHSRTGSSMRPRVSTKARLACHQSGKCSKWTSLCAGTRAGQWDTSPLCCCATRPAQCWPSLITVPTKWWI